MTPSYYSTDLISFVLKFHSHHSHQIYDPWSKRVLTYPGGDRPFPPHTFELSDACGPESAAVGFSTPRGSCQASDA